MYFGGFKIHVMPSILLEKCTRCLKCVKDCPSDSIDLNTGLIEDTCIHCGHCVAICPESAVLPDEGSINPLKSSALKTEDLEVFFSGMRSIRSYQKKEVPTEILGKLTENIKHYSSASNARPLHVTFVTTPAKIQSLNDAAADTLIKTLKIITSPIISPFIRIFAPSLNLKGLKRYNESFIQKKQTNTSMVCHHAPVVMLFHGKKQKYDMSEADAYIWASNTVLYGKSLGLGSCYIGFIVKAMERNKRLREEMNIPEGHRVYAALVLGYPKVSYKNETSRKAPEVHWV